MQQQDDRHEMGGEEGQYDLRWLERGPVSHSPFVGLSDLEDARWVTLLGSVGHIFVTNFSR